MAVCSILFAPPQPPPPPAPAISGTADPTAAVLPPTPMQVGVREVIPGWDLGILGAEGIPPMKEGGKRLLVIPSGAPPRMTAITNDG